MWIKYDKYKHLIKIKDEYKADISSFNKQGLKTEIKFNKSEKSYPYGSKTVEIKENPKVENIINKFVYYRDIPVCDIVKILNFGGEMKIFFKNLQERCYDGRYIKINDDEIGINGTNKILNYWKGISQYVIIKDEPESLLKKVFDKLTSIDPDSVLGSYLNKSHSGGYFFPGEIIFPFRFNLSQKEAIEKVFKSNITIIEGPPGTGKTQTILNIIANLAIMRDETVAVVSNNNSAIQNVKDKLEKEGYGSFVALLGSRDNRGRFFEGTKEGFKFPKDKQGLNTIALSEQLQKISSLMELNNQKAVLQQILSAHLVEKEHFENYYSNQQVEEITKLSFYKNTPEKIIGFLAENNYAKRIGKQSSLLYKLKLFFKFGFTDFKKLKTSEIDIILSLQREFYRLKVQTIGKEIELLDGQLQKNSFDTLLQEYEKCSKELFRSKLHEKFSDLEKLELNATNYKYKFDKFIERFPVMLSTTHSLRNCIPEDFLFEYLIIDESSQVDLLTGALAFSCARNVIIVGDTKQLPQIVNNDIKEKIHVVDIDATYDYFKHSILSSVNSLYGNKIPRTLLKEHYRCNPKIIEFCNQKYYEGKLIPFTKEYQNAEPLRIYRTSEGNHMRDVTEGDIHGKYNQRELDVITGEILTSSEFLQQEFKDIGFVTPYRKQAEKAATVLPNSIESDTVHKYQGREKPIMIMSTVLDNSVPGKIGIPFVDNPNILNVAVSRAQDIFILVTDNSFFNKHGKEIRDLVKYMEYNTLDKNIINSEIVSVFDLLYGEFSKKLISFEKRLLSDSRFKSENIIMTLLSDIIKEDKYNSLNFKTQISLKNLLNNKDKLDNTEASYINHNASVDFVIYFKLDKAPILVVEVDGFAYHENKPEQLFRDALKDKILHKYGLPIIRLPTNASGEDSKIRNKLDELLGD